MHRIKIIAINLVAVLVLFLLIDLGFSFFYTMPGEFNKNITSHPAFGHTLEKQLDYRSNRSGTSRMCTDTHGFKSHCDDINRTSLSFDIVFIGDSFTEGLRLYYEDTFVGMYDLAHPSLKVANLGVGSYSPTRFFKKISYYLGKGLQTKHVVAFIDTNDIYNEYILHHVTPSLFPLKRFIHKHFHLTSLMAMGTLDFLRRNFDIFCWGTPCQPKVQMSAFLQSRNVLFSMLKIA